MRRVKDKEPLCNRCSREVAPVFTMGDANARSFSRGKRSIAGTMVFVQFDRDALMDEMKKTYDGKAPAMMQYQAFKASAGSLENEILGGLKSRNSQGIDTYGVSTWDDQMTRLGYGSGGTFNEDNLTSFYTPEYADQLMPFNVSILMANEFGSRSGMEIYGVQLLNEQSGFSVDDVVTAKAYSFVARKIKGVEKKDDLRQEGRSSYKATNGDILA